MPNIAAFASSNLPQQSPQDLKFGVKTTDLFRVTSSFNTTSEVTAYAMTAGTILLQQHQTDTQKVNLILKPSDQKDFKLPIKYIIYRGLITTNFIESTDITATSNKVKTTGSELLVKMQQIQSSRAPGIDIPVQALFGNELSPLSDKNIDEFFFKNLAAASQLFTIDCGLELGNFSIGEIGIEIILDNPELTISVDIAKRPKYELNVSGISDAPQKKWQKDLVRHFADPAAYYGLHHDIPGGIEYRQGASKLIANTPTAIYQNVIMPFLTKNVLYLDIRNENGYSYNYYDNYVGTGSDASKELKIGQTDSTAELKEYYTQGWAIHPIEITPSGTANDNELFIALRINDNKRPLLSSWSTELIPHSVVDPPLSESSSKRKYFSDENILLPSPIPDPLPDFTNLILIKVPNVPTLTAQLASIVRLSYIRQVLPLSTVTKFPKKNYTDYIFGPLNSNIPWEIENKVSWFSSNHLSFVDALNDGYVLGNYTTAILSINTATNEIEITDAVPVDVSRTIIIENSTPNTQNVGRYNIANRRYSNGKTFIKVQEPLPGPLQSGDQLALTVKLDGEIDYTANKFIIRNNDFTYLQILESGSQLDFYSRFSFSNSFSVISASYTAPDTEILINTTGPITGLSSFAETGAIVETVASVAARTAENGSRLMFYASGTGYFSRDGIKKNVTFPAAGGASSYNTILEGLQAKMPGVIMDKVNLKIQSNNVLAFFYSSASKAKESLLLLGLTAQEQQDAESASSNLSQTHLKLLKLAGQGQSKIDDNGNAYYESELHVAGLNSLGSYEEINTGITIYTIDNIIFSSKEFASEYGIDESQANLALDKFLTILNPQTTNSNFFDDIKDFTVEEKRNLATRWLTGETNKTLFFLDQTMKDKVLQFKTGLDNINENITDIKTLIESTGAALLNYAKARIRLQDQPFSNKDGILYLARLMMQVILKNHPKLLSKFPSDIAALSITFEKHSRGLEGTEKPNFSSYPATSKKVLVTGFDPFDGGLDADGNHSNSSGGLVLVLDSDTSLISSNVIVKSAILPVRFRDFDANWIEDFFRPYVIDPSISMIITFSLSPRPGDFKFDMFAANYRAALSDNLNITPTPKLINSTLNDYVQGEDSFIRNQLPYNKLTDGIIIKIPSVQLPPNENMPSVTVFYRAFWAIYATNNTTSKLEDVTSKHQEARRQTGYYIPFGDYIVPISSVSTNIDNQHSNLIKYFTENDPAYVKKPSWADYPGTGSWVNDYSGFYVDARTGGGGNFLSNELHYRVAYLRKKLSTNKATGHIHMNFMASDINNNRVAMVLAGRELIKKLAL